MAILWTEQFRRSLALSEQADKRQFQAAIAKATAVRPLPQYYLGVAAEVLLSRRRSARGRPPSSRCGFQLKLLERPSAEPIMEGAAESIHDFVQSNYISRVFTACKMHRIG